MYFILVQRYLEVPKATETTRDTIRSELSHPLSISNLIMTDELWRKKMTDEELFRDSDKYYTFPLILETTMNPTNHK